MVKSTKKATLTKTKAMKSSTDNKKVTETYSKDKLVKMGLKLTSSQIRFLSAKGWERSDIANLLGIRYQHVRNVLEMPITTPLEKIDEVVKG